MRRPIRESFFMRKMHHDRIIILSPDTDVALLAISFYHQIRKQLWFRTGVKDKTRFIPIHSIALPCKLLLPIHALSGCDSTSSFAKKGKTKMWNIVKKNLEKYKEISTIGQFITVRQPAVANAKVLVMELYKKEPSIH